MANSIQSPRPMMSMDDPYGEGRQPQVLREPGAKTTRDPYTPEKPLPEHAQRMSVETQEMVARCRNIRAFMLTKTYQELPVLEQQLMEEQSNQMTEYAKTLSLRYCMALLDHR